MSLADYFQRIRDEYAAENARGEHDDECEWRPTGHYLCHCSKRRRIASGFVDPPGPLIHQMPLCPRCDNDVDGDSAGFYCETCSVSWSNRNPDDPGEFTDDYGHLDPARYGPRLVDA